MRRKYGTTSMRFNCCCALLLACLGLGLLNPGCDGAKKQAAASQKRGEPKASPKAPAGAEKSAPQGASTSALSLETSKELGKFDPEALLKEIRRRELTAEAPDLPDVVLERQAEGMKMQPELRSLKRNPLLAKYDFNTLVLALVEKQKVIYDRDDRKEVHQILSDARLQRSADAVVTLFDASRVVPLDDGKTSKIVKKMYGTEYRLCEKEQFYTQPCSAFCSGVLVAPDMIATAGHCVDTPGKTPPVKDIRFVFGYRMNADGTISLNVKNEDVYTGTLVRRVYTDAGADWALVKLDRVVTGRAPVPIRRDSKVADAEDIYVIGHPCGLPAKFADGAIVRKNSDSDFFVANLDTYGGNSGSPVFNRETHVVEGLLVRGERDFTSQTSPGTVSCNISLVCPNTGCRGEDCVRTTLFASLVPTPNN
jgi:V8-like Glu-specific endopeptidase